MPEKHISSTPKTESNTQESLLNMYTRKKALSHFLGVATQQNFTDHLGQLDFVDTVTKLVEEGKRIQNGNLVHIERVLLIQAQTLDTIFNNLACRASQADFVGHLEPFMRLALKAQSQCRATLETLANIKNPPHVAFVKQANIGHNQQVNNGVATLVPNESSHAREIKNEQTQLLEENHERVDIGAPKTSGRADKKLAAVGKINRSQKSRR